MMTCPTCGHSETLRVVEMIEQQTTVRCTDEDNVDGIEVKATMAQA